MRNLVLGIILLFAGNAIGQEFPQPSPLAKVYQEVGLTTIEVEYSSPAAKGRTLFGDLIPYNQLWRTGANRATKITFSHRVKFGGEEVEAGTYAIFTTPTNSGNIAVMLNSNWNQGGTSSYNDSLNVCTISTKIKETECPAERMRFTIENTTSSTADLVFTWGKHTFKVPIGTYTQEIVDERFEAKVQEYDREYALYADAANYYLEVGNMDKAKAMGEKSVNLTAKFWNTHTLAKIYAEMGDTEAALKEANRSLELSKKADYKPYIKMNEELIAKLQAKKK